MRSGFHRKASFQPRVHPAFVGHVLLCRPRSSFRPIGREREQLQTLAVQRQLDVQRLVEAFNLLVTVPGQSDLEFVLAVDREIVLEDRSAASAVWQAFHVIVLGVVQGQHDSPGLRRTGRYAHRQATDLA